VSRDLFDRDRAIDLDRDANKYGRRTVAEAEGSGGAPGAGAHQGLY